LQPAFDRGASNIFVGVAYAVRFPVSDEPRFEAGDLTWRKAIPQGATHLGWGEAVPSERGFPRPLPWIQISVEVRGKRVKVGVLEAQRLRVTEIQMAVSLHVGNATAEQPALGA